MNTKLAAAAAAQDGCAAKPSSMIKIAALECFLVRVAERVPKSNPLGQMATRTALLIRVEDSDGADGWGETWCTYPEFGGEHRRAIIERLLAPQLIGHTFNSPQHAFSQLWEACRTVAMATGEPGPFSQAIAGVDLAIWDLCARKANQPLWRFLGGTAPKAVRLYASGIWPGEERTRIEACLKMGFTAFKFRYWGMDRTRFDELDQARNQLGSAAEMMVDVNQSWEPRFAYSVVDRVRALNLRWLEEPVPLPTPTRDWRRLASAMHPVPLASGENLYSVNDFDRVLSDDIFRVVQPSIAKWCGYSHGLPLARKLVAHGASLCPHCLGSGVIVRATAHLLAAVASDGILETYANSNPISSDIVPMPMLAEGCLELGERPGLGVTPDRAVLAALRVPS